jgi:cation transport ATPase
MNNQNPNPDQNQPTNPSPEPPPTYHDWHEQRRAERWARHEQHWANREARWQRRGWRHTGWFFGALLILLGVALLMQNLGLPFFTNWWALFILIPAFWAYVAAWDIYQENHRLTRRVASSLTVGILFTILTLIFLFNLTVGFFWPALLILGGLALLGSALFPE